MQSLLHLQENTPGLKNGRHFFKSFFLVSVFFLFCSHEASAANVAAFLDLSEPVFTASFRLSLQEALKNRAEKVIDANDALIRKTVHANGGYYFHRDNNKILIFNQKVYKDFSMKVIRGKRLIIETADGEFAMDVVKE